MTEKTKNNKKTAGKSTAVLIALCWLVYTCSYIGKLGYSANIVKIQEEFGVTKGAAGLAGTFFFFAYGAGQIINGLFCKKYNIKYVVFGALLISCACNAVVATASRFSVLKYAWFINGAALSVLWPLLIRLLSETLSDKDCPHAVVVMSTTVAVGTFLVYAFSAAFVALGNYRITFYTASVLLPVIALLWIFSYSALTKKVLKERNDIAGDSEEEVVCVTKEKAREKGKDEPKQSEKKNKLGGEVITVIVFLALFAVVTNLVKDGLTTWVPSILKEKYAFSDAISIILTLTLPILSLFGTAFAVKLNKKIKDFVTLCGVLFAAAAVLIMTAELTFSISAAILIICFAAVSLLASASNNVITSMAPLYMRETVNAGMLAGLLNGACYIGSTLSSYGLGSFADAYGWDAVFMLLGALAALCAITAFVYSFAQKRCKRS